MIKMLDEMNLSVDHFRNAYDALAAVGDSEAAHALVVSDGRLVGLLAITDLQRALEAASGDAVASRRASGPAASG